MENMKLSRDLHMMLNQIISGYYLINESMYSINVVAFYWILDNWLLLNMSNIVVNPANQALVRLRFNIMADDIEAEFNNFINAFGVELTVGGEQCGDRMTTHENLQNPIIAEFIAAAEGIIYGYTELMVTRGSAYSYAFLGAGSWKQCTDIKNYRVQGATSADFRSSYRNLDKSSIGPAGIIDAIMSLSFNSSTSWAESFRYLCYVFIESVRLIEFGDFVRDTLVNGAGWEKIYVYTQLIPDNIKAQPNCWGQASNALRGFFLGQPPRTHWSVSPKVLVVFGSTSMYETERSTAAAIENEQERRRALNLAEVNLCQSRVRIVMHG